MLFFKGVVSFSRHLLALDQGWEQKPGKGQGLGMKGHPEFFLP